MPSRFGRSRRRFPVLFAALATAVTLSAVAGSTALADPGAGRAEVKPVVSYNFDGNATDSSHNHNDGTWTGTASYQPGIKGKAAYVSGGTNYVTLPRNPQTTPSNGSMAVEFWYHEIKASQGGGIFGNEDWRSGANPGMEIYNLSGTTQLSALYGGNSARSTGLFDTTCSWNYVAVVIDGAARTMTTYRDGVPVATLNYTSTAPLDSGLPFRIGADGSGTLVSSGAYPNSWANGLVDDFNYYDAPISSTQVKADFNAIKPSATTLSENGQPKTCVGTQPDGAVQLPSGQQVAPDGQRTKLTAQVVGQAISPDGTKVAVQTGGVASGAANLNILDASTGAILQTFGGRYDAPPVYSPDGTALYAASTNTIFKYTVDPSTGLVTNPTAPQTLTTPGSRDFPFGLAVSADGSTLYATLNGSNQLDVINASTMQLTTAVPVGTAPVAVAVVGDQAFVSDRGGKVPAAGDTTNTSDGTAMDIDPKTGATTNGTVSVVDLTTNTVTDTIKVGLQPGAVTAHDGSVFVANTNSDTVSIINATSHRVTQTFNVKPLPGSSVGASPNSITFAGPNTLLVSAGGDNAIAEFGYNGPTRPVQYRGLIPTDWYPNQVNYDAKINKVIVSNEYGVGTDGSSTTSQVVGTETSFAPPSSRELDTLTDRVFDNNGWNHLPASNQPASKDKSAGKAKSQPAAAVPTKLGEPSAIKHVFLIVKENRTYDQVLGDLDKGNGSQTNVNYGATVTPNAHSLADQFTDFDNFYNAGEQSADGNIWINEVEPNDYLAQKQATGFTRNANGQLALDPLNIQRTGYIWEAPLKAGKTVRLYGEGDGAVTGSYGTWQQYYADSQILEGKASGTLPVAENSMQDTSEIPAANPLLDHNFPTFNVNIPDQYRVDVWDQEFQQQLATDSVPDFTFMSLPDDHTGGLPTPTAQVADNDLAIGRMIDEISHSKVWKDSAIFVEEDDTSSGADHVDGHRGPLYIASPYATRGLVNSDYYTTINVDKTIEQILGAQPLNQYDRAAVPMFDAFTNKPDYTPYDFAPNQVPLTQGVSNLIPLTPAADTAGKTATASVTATSGPAAPAVPADEKSTAAAWATWDRTVAQPALTGPHATRDSVNPPQLNRYDWYTATNWSKPYPGDTKILTPDEVPGRNVPTAMTGDK